MQQLFIKRYQKLPYRYSIIKILSLYATFFQKILHKNTHQYTGSYLLSHIPKLDTFS